MSDKPDMKSAALDYAARGWRVFPVHTPTGDPERPCSCGRPGCENIGKHPRTRNGCLDATSDPAKVERWWTMFPDANIGIATGEGSGFWVLDVDGEEGEETLRRIETANGAELSTVEQITGSGGRHLFFHHEPDLKGVVGFAPGLDARSEGNYIVAPPSLHASGRRYCWEASSHPDDVFLAAAPPWITRLIPKRGQAPTNGNHPTDPKIPEGRRQVTLWSNACAMRRRGMGEAAIRAAVREQNKDCVPPLSDAAVDDIARRAARYKPAEVDELWMAHDPAQGPYGTPTEERNKDGPLFPLIEFKQLCDLPPLIYQIDDLFLEESLVQCYGETNHGKSLWLWDLVCHVCYGTERWFGRQINIHGPVVWVNADGGRGLSLRAQAWTEAHPGPLRHPLYTLMGSVYLNQPQQINAFKAQLLDLPEKPVLVVFDTQSRCMPGGRENDQDEMTMVTEGLHRLKMALGCTVIPIHHTDKTGRWERGSGVVKNESDTQIRVTKDEDSGIFTVSCEKGRDHPPFADFYFRTRPVLGSVVVVPTDDEPPRDATEEKHQKQHELHLLICSSPGITYEQSAYHLSISEKSVRRYAAELEAMKLVIRAELPKTEGSRGSAKVGLFPNPDQLFE